MKREFVITNGKMYIHYDIDGKYTPTSNLSLAEVYDSQSKAGNIKKNCLSRALAQKYYVAEIVEGELFQCDIPSPPKAKTKKGSKSFAFENHFGEMKWCKGFVGLDKLLDEAVQRYQVLGQEISDVESKIIDVEHYIEFKQLNARNGYMAYKKLKELLCERRRLKNEQKIINEINKNQSVNAPIKKIISVIEEGDKYSYKPRILVDMFETNNLDI